jgi:hypothetical protein
MPSEGDNVYCKFCGVDLKHHTTACPYGTPLITDEFALHERCLQEGLCPRGCGPLVQKSYKERVCPVCGFRHFNANPERAPHTID